MKEFERALRVLILASFAAVLGCGREAVVAPPPVETVTLTNVVERIREVVVTNVVNVTVTNVVIERREPERRLSARKTAPYLVASSSFDVAQLRKLASDSAARVIECGRGSVALVEASDKAADLLSRVAIVSPLSPFAKIASGTGENVRIVPLSSIDSAAVTRAVRELGGEVVQVVTEGSPAIRAKLAFASICKLAERGDVRRIERDGK